MKKIILALIFLISCSVFATGWKTIELEDEFKEPTGQVRILKMEKGNKGSVFIDKNKTGHEIGFLTIEYIGGKGKYDESLLKIKIDDNSPITVKGYVWVNNKKIVSGTLNTKLLELMKNGKTMKVVIEKYNSETIFLEFNLEGLSEYLEKLK